MLRLKPRRGCPDITFQPVALKQGRGEVQAPTIPPRLVEALLEASQALALALRHRGLHLDKESQKEVLHLMTERALRNQKLPTQEDATQTLAFWILRGTAEVAEAPLPALPCQQ